MMLSSVADLDELLSDRLLFTNQDGRRLSKADDLAAHRSGLLKIQRLDHRGAPEVLHIGDTTVVCVEYEMAGHFDGQGFEGAFAYTRVWHLEGGRWRVIAAHCSAIVEGG